MLPHPCVNLVLDRGRLAIAGVGRDRFTYVYRGAGRVFGVKFRPGAFLPFLGVLLVLGIAALIVRRRLMTPPSDEATQTPSTGPAA